jgi:hypothetical protein
MGSLKAYLESPLEEVSDVIRWWGVSIFFFFLLVLQYCFQEHQSRYPTLARMARDYLAIQGSATASERAFSGGALTATKLRNRLKPDIFEALQLLKGAIGMATFLQLSKLPAGSLT